MINIIKHGKKTITKTFYKCICPVCNCEFEATEDEFETVTKCLLGEFADVNCPDCGNTLHLNSTLHTHTREEEFIDYDQQDSSTIEK